VTPNRKDNTMKSIARTSAIALTISLAAVLPVRADHIPGHDDADPVFPVPIPGQEDFSGGAAWVSAIGPFGGSEIFNARFDITYVSDGATPASNMLLNVGLLIEDGVGGAVYVETVVTGADLGFGSGPGTFHGTWETADLNGIAVENFLVAPYSLIDVIIDSTDGGIAGTGYFEDSFIYFDLVDDQPACPADTDGSGTVDVDDLTNVILDWGNCCSSGGDIDGDGDADVDDMTEVILGWGPCS
jgi:hypothetical protein